MRRKAGWFYGSLRGLVLQVFIVQSLTTFILNMFFDSSMFYLGIPQIMFCGWIVGITYRDKFKKDLDRDIKHRISRTYLIILVLIILILALLENFISGSTLYFSILYIFIGSIFSLLAAFLLYWSLGLATLKWEKEK